MKNTMNINLHIERLVLDGLPISYNHRTLVQAAVEAELARLVALGGLSPRLQAADALPFVPGGSIHLKSDGNPRTLGQQIAQVVYGGIGGGGE